MLMGENPLTFMIPDTQGSTTVLFNSKITKQINALKIY